MGGWVRLQVFLHSWFGYPPYRAPGKASGMHCTVLSLPTNRQHNDVGSRTWKFPVQTVSCVFFFHAFVVCQYIACTWYGTLLSSFISFPHHYTSSHVTPLSHPLIPDLSTFVTYPASPSDVYTHVATLRTINHPTMEGPCAAAGTQNTQVFDVIVPSGGCACVPLHQLPAWQLDNVSWVTCPVLLR